jgi:glycosyltransferase involved in cell wall biosynthesis
MSLKILTIVYSLAKGGTERAAQNFATGYAALGVDSRVLFTEHDGIRRTILEDSSIPVYSLREPFHLELIRKWEPCLVHLHSHGLSTFDFQCIRVLLPSAMFVETSVFSVPSPWIRDIDMSFQLTHWCQWLYKTRSLAICPAGVIPNPVDTHSFSYAGLERVRRFKFRYGISIDDPVIGRIGQAYNGKWSPMLINIFDRLKALHPRLKLILVNPPSPIIARAKASPHSVDIICIEELSDDTSLQDCYSSIDVFIHIADQGESFGMVLAESLLCETPVVTLATPWHDNSQGEVVGNGVGGYLAANANTFASLVDKLLVDPDLRSRLGRAGRKRIIELFDSRTVASNALNLIGLNVGSDRFQASIPLGFTQSTPYQLMANIEGKIDFFSRWILLSERHFFLLRYTTGYESPIWLFPAVFKMIVARLQRFLRATQSG